MNKKVLITILVILGLAIIVGGFWYYLQLRNDASLTRNDEKGKQEQNQKMDNNKENGNQEGQQNENGKESDFKKIDTSNWKEYCNKEYGFCVKYPEGWKYDLIDGVTFGNKDKCERDAIDYYWCKNYITFAKSDTVNNFNDFKYTKSRISTMTDNNIMYRKSKNKDNSTFSYYVFNTQKGKGWSIIIKYYNDEQYKDEINTMKKMITTFRILK